MVTGVAEVSPHCSIFGRKVLIFYHGHYLTKQKCMLDSKGLLQEFLCQLCTALH